MPCPYLSKSSSDLRRIQSVSTIFQRLQEEVGLEKLKPSFSKLADPDKEIVLEGIREIERYLPGLKGSKFKEALSSLSSLFYVDTFERPDLQPVIDRAFETFKRFRAKTIPFLLSSTRESDFKFQLNLARALGKIGKPAIKPIL